MPDSMKSLCVFCASSNAIDPRYLGLAADAGRWAASQGWRIIYGGAKGGMMGALAGAALEEGGEVIGVIPEVLGPQERAHTGLTQLHVVSDMHARQKKMADLADGFLILPGGLGTLAEFFEILTWKAIGLHTKPIAVINAFNYWDKLLAQVDQAEKEGFLHAEHAKLFKTYPDLKGIDPFLLLD